MQIPKGLELPAAVAGALILLVVLYDTFETMVLPRSGGFGIRLTRFYFAFVWGGCRILCRGMKPDNPFRRTLLAAFAPLSLVYLIVLWACLMIVGFALVLWGVGSPITARASDHVGQFGDYLYLSGVTLFTLGYGDKLPGSAATRTLCVTEAGVGFGLLATVIGYLPTLYQTFARREAMIVRLYARAGAAPNAEVLVRRHCDAKAWQALESFLREWEQWGAELLESYGSYPMLAFYRSQNDTQSWLAAAVTMRAVCRATERHCPPDAPERGSLLLQAEATETILTLALQSLAKTLRLEQGDSPEDKIARRLLLSLPGAGAAEERGDGVVEGG